MKQHSKRFALMPWPLVIVPIFLMVALVWSMAVSAAADTSVAAPSIPSVNTTVGETGTVSATTSWQTVNLTNSYNDPVVVAYINTRNGGESVDVRIRNVTGSSFQIFMEEPDGQGHQDETAAYIVMEKGRHTLDGGLIVEAGSVDTSSVHVAGNSFGGAAVAFSAQFLFAPAVLHTLNSYNNSSFMSSVAHSVSASGFTVQQEAGASGSTATTETIGWIAFATGSGTTSGYDYEIGAANDGTDDGVDDTPHTITFSSFTAAPDVVVKGNSGNGTDGYWARGAGTYNSTTQTVYAEEDQVGDTERSHTDETFAWAAFDSNAVFTEICSNPIYVDVDASGANNGRSWTDAFTALNDALDAVASCSGYELWIAEGIYYPDLGAGRVDDDPTESFTLSSDVTLYGGFDGTETALNQRDVANHVSILSGDIDENDTTTGGVVMDINDISGTNSYHVISGTNVSNVVIDGVTLTAGKSGGSGAEQNGAALYLTGSDATLMQVTVSGNHATGTGQGAIHGYDTDLTVSDSSFSNNRAVDGGAVYSHRDSGTHVLTVSDSSFTSNWATDTGGAIYVEGSQQIDVTKSSFTSNRAQDSGGAVYLISAGTGSWQNVAFVGNHGDTGGGAMLSIFGQGQTFETALFSGNHTIANGGAIYNDRVPLTVINATFHGNRTRGVYGGTQEGGGVYINDTGSRAEVFENVIFWNNLGESQVYSATEQIDINDSGGVPPVISYSNIQNSGGSGGSWTLAGATDGGNNIDADPLFVTDIDPTTTPTTAGDSHLQIGSPAINSGNDSVVTVSTDLAGNARLNGTVDMGAYEAVSLCFVEATGDNTTDFESFDAGAVQSAINAASANDTLKIAGTCAGVNSDGGQTQTVYIDKDLTLIGGYNQSNWSATPDPLAYTTTLDAESNGRVVRVASGVTAVLENLTMINGFSTGIAGGIYNQGGLILRNSVVSGSVSNGNGGGIFVNPGTLTVENSWISNNTALGGSSWGGGIHVAGGAVVTVTDSMIAYNEAQIGGGINNRTGTVTLENTTVYSNTVRSAASNDGGGIINRSSSLTLINSTVSDNRGTGITNWQHNSSSTATLVIRYSTIVNNDKQGIRQIVVVSNPQVSGTLTGTIVTNNLSADCVTAVGAGAVFDVTGGYNLDSDGTCVIDGVDNNVTSATPLLDVIQNNGGPATGSGDVPWTHGLLSGSPALDVVPTGISGCGSTNTQDQRGIPRAQNSYCDMGAFERIPLVVTGTLPLSNTAHLDWNDTVHDEFALWRSTLPYSGYLPFTTHSLSEADVAVDPAQSYYYEVYGVFGGNPVEVSNRVGVFTFAVTPGN